MGGEIIIAGQRPKARPFNPSPYRSASGAKVRWFESFQVHYSFNNLEFSASPFSFRRPKTYPQTMSSG
jgi:hypothetical protein